MKLYISAGILDNFLKRVMKGVEDSFKDAFSSQPPKLTKVKDPDTDVVGTLHKYKCEHENHFLCVEMYPAPFEKNSYMVKAYCLDGSSIQKDTIEILNPEKAGVFQPIPAKKVSKYLTQYVDDNFDFLGSFEDADKVDEDTQVDEDDDGFEEADDAEADEI